MAEVNQTLDTKSGKINRLNGARRKQPRPYIFNRNDSTSGNQRQMGQHADQSNHSGYSMSTGKQGYLTNGQRQNAIPAEEKVTMVVSVNMPKTNYAVTVDVVGIFLECVEHR